MDLEIARERYRQYLQIINRSPKGIKDYLWYLDKFIKHLYSIEIIECSDITLKHLLDYQKLIFYHKSSRGGGNYAVSTQNRVVSAIKDFFEFLREEEIIFYNPAKKLSYARRPKTLPKIILTPKEVKKILSQPDINSYEGYRDRTILELLYSTGLRRNEIRDLKLSEIDYKEGFIRVNQGKGQKDRVVPIGDIACHFLENYITGIRLAYKNSEILEYLFISRMGNKLSKNVIGELIHRYCHMAKIKKRTTCHTFRHTCATHMIKNRANLRHVQQMLGHASLTSTEQYLHLTITDLKEAHKKYHPRERDKK